jgi:hypothetical protein
MIIPKSFINDIFHQLMDLKIQNNSLNFPLKPYLPLEYNNGFWIIKKLHHNDLKILGSIKNHINNFKKLQIYQNHDILFNDLMADKIDGIIIKDFNEIPINFFVGLVNINEKCTNKDFILFNGFAFRKNNHTEFDTKYQSLFIEVIEKTAKNNKDLWDYIVIQQDKIEHKNQGDQTPSEQ